MSDTVTTNDEPTAAPNVRQLAILIGRPRGTVLDWTLSPSWPGSTRTGPFTADDVAKIRVWAEQRPRRTARLVRTDVTRL